MSNYARTAQVVCLLIALSGAGDSGTAAVGANAAGFAEGRGIDVGVSRGVQGIVASQASRRVSRNRAVEFVRFDGRLDPRAGNFVTVVNVACLAVAKLTREE